MRTSITAQVGLRIVDINYEGQKSIQQVLADPGLSRQISAPETANVLVNGGEVGDYSYILKTGDTLSFEKRATDKA